MNLTPGIVFLLIFLTGCSTENKDLILPNHIKDVDNLTIYSDSEKGKSVIDFKKDKVVGDTDTVFIEKVGNISVDEKNRIYIADAPQYTIHLYSSDGDYLSSVGREGDGPGEFRDVSHIQVAENQLFVFDRNQQRVVRFSPDSLSNYHTVNIADNRNSVDELSETFLNKLYIKENETFLMSFTKSDIPEGIKNWEKIENIAMYYFLDKNGQVASDKLFEVKSSIELLAAMGQLSVGWPADFLGKSLLALSDEGQIFETWSNDFLIKTYTPEGNYQQAFYYPFEKVPLNPNSAFADNELIQRGVGSIDFPDTWPVLDNMLVDDENRLWISTIVEDFEIYEWWILEETGELITKFEWPRDEPIEVVKNGYMYTCQTDEETGLQQVVRYGIEMEKL